MSRRFLYMVLEEGRHPANRLYTLYRIHPSLLFYPKDSPERAASAAAAGATATTMAAVAAAADARAKAKAKAMWRWREEEVDLDWESAELHGPIMTFPSPYVHTDFALTGRNKDQIVASERRDFQYRFELRAPRRAVLYDDASRSVRDLTPPELEDVPLAVGEDDEMSVRGLIRGPAHDYDWHRYTYPPSPPPYLGGDAYGPYAAPVDGSYIWASARGHGTYSMHTVTGEWSKVGDRVLQFQGRAVCAPEHGLCFGFPYGNSSLLGAWDLRTSSDGGAAAPVESRGVWEGFRVPDRSYDLRSHLVHLGDGGRFCVAKLFSHTTFWFAVLTGVEVERCDGGELGMIKHRSLSYKLSLVAFESLAVEAHGVWEGFRVPDRSYYLRSHLVHLGDGGRLCVAKLFSKERLHTTFWFAVLTDVEVERCDGGELRMIKHRSSSYKVGGEKSPYFVF